MKASSKVVANTGILYVQMVISIAVSLFSTRIVLNALGASDYGIFNVIAGVIGMLGFLNAAMTTATQRFLSYNMGINDLSKVKRVFANSVTLHLILGFALVIVFELIGLSFLENKLKIDPDRLFIAKILFHFSVVDTFLAIISVPYDAVINAHENMLFVALSSIFESLAKLGIAYYLLVTSQDRLFTYGLLIMILALSLRIFKRFYCKIKYAETKVSLKAEYDKKMIIELTSFAGWNLFGVLCSIFRNQGVSVVLNLFYGTVVNAAYGISNQVNGQLAFLSQTMMKTIRPQMVKSEGAGDRPRMLRLSIFAGKFSFYLFSIFCIPLLIEMPFVLALWLKKVPDNTILFCRLILILTLIQQLSMGIMAAMQAIGKIKLYQTVAGTIQLLTLPIGYVFLRLGYPSYSILVVAVGLEVAASIFRIYYFARLTETTVTSFAKTVLAPSIFPFVVVLALELFIGKQLSNQLIQFGVVCASSFVVYASLIYLFGMNSSERVQVQSIVLKLKNKLG